MNPVNQDIQHAASILAGARQAVALTGAGISVESGIPPFRGKGGLWEKIDPFKYAHINAFKHNPAEVWLVLFKELNQVLEKASPNPGHRGLFRLEQMGILHTIITQNIDGLHQRAGSSDVIEFHGTFTLQRCDDCHRTCQSCELDLTQMPPHCRCGGVWRPDVVMFGEPIAMDHLNRAQMLAAACDLMLVVGTSATVQPAASLPVLAKHYGAFILEINPETTSLTGTVSDLTLLGQAGVVIDQLVTAIDSQ